MLIAVFFYYVRTKISYCRFKLQDLKFTPHCLVYLKKLELFTTSLSWAVQTIINFNLLNYKLLIWSTWRCKSLQVPVGIRLRSPQKALGLICSFTCLTKYLIIHDSKKKVRIITKIEILEVMEVLSLTIQKNWLLRSLL